MLRAIVLSVVTAGAVSAQAVESVAGVLERGMAHSALWVSRAEDGEMVGYVFRNDSVAGQVVLSHCLPGMMCQVQQGHSRAVPEGMVWSPFVASARVWRELTHADGVEMVAAASRFDDRFKSRFGWLSVSPENATLMFRGKAVHPEVEGYLQLGVVAHFSMGRADVVLLQSRGGASCPALYRFATVTAQGVAVTPEFGTCSPVFYPVMGLRDTVNVAMTGFASVQSSPEVQRFSRMTKVVYTYQSGRISVNGYPLN